MKVLKDCSFLSVVKVDKMVSYLIGCVMGSMLALSVLDPWDRAQVWSNQGRYNWYLLILCY
jgi:hypothetical protein